MQSQTPVHAIQLVSDIDRIAKPINDPLRGLRIITRAVQRVQQMRVDLGDDFCPPARVAAELVLQLGEEPPDRCRLGHDPSSARTP